MKVKKKVEAEKIAMEEVMFNLGRKPVWGKRDKVLGQGPQGFPVSRGLLLSPPASRADTNTIIKSRDGTHLGHPRNNFP